jgi:hypothetical protein
MARLGIGEKCQYCKQGSMELHYFTKRNSLDNDASSSIFWKCDNPECEYIVPAKEDGL